MMIRYIFSISVAVLLVALYFSRRSGGPNNGQPNIVFILADDLGFNDIGYHNSEIKSPHIDKVRQ